MTFGNSRLPLICVVSSAMWSFVFAESLGGAAAALAAGCEGGFGATLGAGAEVCTPGSRSGACAAATLTHTIASTLDVPAMRHDFMLVHRFCRPSPAGSPGREAPRRQRRPRA